MQALKLAETADTTSTLAAVEVVAGEFMTVLAVRLASVLGGNADASQDVLADSHWLKMVWIHAVAIAA